MFWRLFCVLEDVELLEMAPSTSLEHHLLLGAQTLCFKGSTYNPAVWGPTRFVLKGPLINRDMFLGVHVFLVLTVSLSVSLPLYV